MTCWLPESRFFGLKASMLRWCGAMVGKNVRIASSAVIAGDGVLEIGDDVWIGAGDRISPTGTASVKIGSHIDFGPEVMILTGSHEIDPDGEHIGGKGISRDVVISDGCWLGARAVILPGVRLAERIMVAAGSVVTKPCETPKSLLAGVPAAVKKSY